MPNDPILHLLGLARKAGKLELGEEPVGALCRARHARLVLLANNAAPNTYRRAAHFGEAGNVLHISLPHSKEELGFCFGRGSVAIMALADAGLAASLLDKLAAADPERYGPAAAQLRTKADKMLQRQREKRQHEKNLREGKRKPWAPPPPPAHEERPPRAHKPHSPVSPDHPPKCSKPKPPGQGGSAHHSQPGPGRPGTPRKPAPGGRRLSGKFRQKP